jgi:hypothetical protein
MVLAILTTSPKDIRHIERSETSPTHRAILRSAQDGGHLFGCLPQRDWATQDNIHEIY